MTLHGKVRFYVSEGSGIAAVSLEDIAEYVQAQGATVEWDAIQGKPATFAPTVGTTADTAKAGDWQPGPNDMAVAQPVKNFLGASDFDGMQSDLSAAPTAADFNGLLAKLKAAKVLT